MKYSKQLYGQIIDNLSEGICIALQNSLEIIHINAQLQKMFHLDSDGYVGKPIWPLFASTGFPLDDELSNILGSLEETGCWTKEIANNTIEEKSCWTKLSITRFEHLDLGWVWLMTYSDISPYRQNEGDLKKINEELELHIAQITVELQRKDIALAEVMNQLDVERVNLVRKIDVNTQKLMLPILERLIEKSSSLDSRYLTVLKQNLNALTSSFGMRLASVEYRLTPKEIELCTLIRGGFTIKEIASMQNLSERTVETHRFNIRKKLGLSSTKTNLATFLVEL